MTEIELEALARVINYNWKDEEIDYNNQDDEDRVGHIFLDLQVLNDYVASR